MWRNILSGVARRQAVKNGTQAAVKAQQRRQRDFEKRQKQKAADWNSVGEYAIYRAYPPMVGYYASIGPFWTGIMGFLMIFLVGMLLYIFGYSVYEDGWASTIDFIRDGLEACRWYHVVGIVLYVLFMGSLFLVSPFLTKYMENTETIFTNRCVRIRRYLRKEKMVTYDELAVSIMRRKIRIQNGRYMIPCKGIDISIPMIEGEFPGDLFRLLEKKCGIRLPEKDFKERARRSGVGWACGHLGGAICFVFALFISVLIFLMEGEFTWEKAFHDLTVNPLMHLVLVLVGIGLLCNLIFLPSAAWVYRNFRKTVRVSWMPILVDALILMLSINGYEHFNGVSEAHEEEMRIQTEAEVRQEMEQSFICAFSHGVWGKEFSEVTAEEFASIKYIAADYGGAGQTVVRYSLVDYKDCASEQEFQRSIQTWQCGEDEILPTPADISMLTGLTYVEVPEYNTLEQSILPTDNQITRIEMEDSPKALKGVANPDTLEVLRIYHYEEENQFDFLRDFPNLKELEYINISCHDTVDLQSLACVESLERLHLSCGDSYVNVDVLQNADKLQSLYIDNATLKQCDFVKELQGLEELTLCYGMDGDLTMVSNMPKLKRLWLLDDVAVEASELEALSSVEELKIVIDTMEGLDAIRELKDALSVLDITFKDGVDWSFYWHSEEFLDLSILTEMTKLKELRVGFDGYFQVKGIEQLLSMAELKVFSLAGEWFGRETLVCLDETQMVDNNNVETLSLSKCLMRDKEGEQLAEDFLARFKGVKSLSLVGFEEIRESYDFLSEYKNLESLTVDRIYLTESQMQELEAWEEEIDVIYR